VIERYEIIAREEGCSDESDSPLCVRRMCEILEVSRSGYYNWKSREPSETMERRAILTVLIKAIFLESRETYGHRRVAAQLARQGRPAGPELVRMLMRAADLQPKQKRAYKRTTMQDPEAEPADDLVRRNFTAVRPGQRLVGDITYIAVGTRFGYLATVIDCYSKAIVGWAFDDHMRATLPIQALHMAARNHPLEADCIFHSDRGTQYTSREFRKALKSLKMRGSMGRTGVCWDNAMAESAFASIKNELTHHVRYETISEARSDIANYIELFYNQSRLHSGLGYRTPNEVHYGVLISHITG
jgi:transposase InsO family protein